MRDLSRSFVSGSVAVALAVMAVIGLPSLAGAQSGDDLNPPAPEYEGVQAGDGERGRKQRLEAGREQLDRQAERRERRRSRESRERRERSKRAHKGKGDRAAIELAESTFAEELRPSIPDAETTAASHGGCRTDRARGARRRATVLGRDVSLRRCPPVR